MQRSTENYRGVNHIEEPRNLFSSRKPIDVLLFTRYRLAHDALKALIEKKSEISIHEFASTPEELLERISEKEPDIILFCVSDVDDIGCIELMPSISDISPETKVILLSSINAGLDLAKALRFGVKAIVRTDQKEKVLIRSIRRVSEGEICLNQEMVECLLSDGNGNKTNSNGGSSNGLGLYENDPVTKREMEVIKVAAQGKSTREIGEVLFINEATVRHHLSSIYLKLNIPDRLNLIIYAYQHNLVCKPDEELRRQINVSSHD